MTNLKPTKLVPYGYKPLEVEIVIVTPEKAREWLALNQGNRNKRRRVIDAYARDLAHGYWLVTGESIKFDWNGRLIDGQHRLEATIAANVPLETLVVWNLDPAVQKVLDMNARRSGANALRFAGVQVQQKDIASVARVHTAWTAGSLTNALSSMAGTILTNSELIAWYESNPDVDQAVAFARRISRNLGSTTAGLGAAILELMRIDIDDTIEFLDSAAEMKTDGTGDPRKALRDAFSKIRSDRRAPSPAETLHIVFRSWNAWQKQQPLKLIKHGSSDGKGGITGVSIPRPVQSGGGA